MSDGQDPESLAEEERLGSLICQGGVRPRPDARLQATVREAVAAEWRTVTAARRRRRQRWSLAAAAVFASIIIGTLVPRLMEPGSVVATVTRVNGIVTIDGGRLLTRPVRAAAGEPLRAGSAIRAGTGGRLALEIDGIALRLDKDSELVVLAADRVELRHGAVYLDSAAQGAASPSLLIDTHLGSIEHLGTQYEARVSGDALRVRVREGRVQLQRADGEIVQGRVGEQLMLDSGGALSRQYIARDDGGWAWVSEIAPAYDIDEQSLFDFLRWVSRETGRELVFGSPAVEQAARTMILHGSMQELSPERALSAVLVATSLRYTKTPEGLRVEFRTGE
ncbi:MAG: FecR domain-containing protein [Gammaproteobacteria bacterium]|nr:FecR domain-containing protein [Gammaproteobacteria bacterium]